MALQKASPVLNQCHFRSSSVRSSSSPPIVGDLIHQNCVHTLQVLGDLGFYRRGEASAKRGPPKVLGKQLILARGWHITAVLDEKVGQGHKQGIIGQQSGDRDAKVRANVIHRCKDAVLVERFSTSCLSIAHILAQDNYVAMGRVLSEGQRSSRHLPG